MSYIIKEIFYSLQGEGFNAGRAAIFCRFAGCNLWNGKESGRENAICKFCDTDFVGTDGTGGGIYEDARQLAEDLKQYWPQKAAVRPFVVLTGGEPLLQVDQELVDTMKAAGFTLAIETNGTLPLSISGIDWICVSPKAGTELKIRKGNELKLVFPQDGTAPEDYSSLSFDHFFLQPKDGPGFEDNILLTAEYCMQNPAWRISLQTHKIIGIR